jgi:hypothetical protein
LKDLVEIGVGHPAASKGRKNKERGKEITKNFLLTFGRF